MLTGKIYKNKLAVQPEEQAHQLNQNTRQIMRVKSQPGLKSIPNLPKPDNVESMEQGTVKNQR